MDLWLAVVYEGGMLAVVCKGSEDWPWDGLVQRNTSTTRTGRRSRNLVPLLIPFRSAGLVAL